MNKLFALLLLSIPLAAQSTDYSTATYTKPFSVTATTPTTCTAQQGDSFQWDRTTMSLYYCPHAGGSWTLFAGGMVYPGAGVANSTGSAWGTSYTVGTGNNNLVQLNGSAQLPAVSAALLTNFPTFNQSTTGNAATATNLASYPTLCTGGQFSQGLSTGSNNCGTPSGSGFSLTTTGTSGAATYGGGVLNIPVYSSGAGSVTWQYNGASVGTSATVNIQGGSNGVSATTSFPGSVAIYSLSADVTLPLLQQGTTIAMTTNGGSSQPYTGCGTPSLLSGSVTKNTVLDVFFDVTNAPGATIQPCSLGPYTLYEQIGGSVVAAVAGDILPYTPYLLRAYTGGTSSTTVTGFVLTTNTSTGLANPMTAAGDLIYGGTSGTPTRLPTGTAKQLLQAGTTPTYIDFPHVMDIPAANCNNATGGTGWSLPASAAPTVACRAGTNNLGGVLQFADANNAQFDIEIPGDADLTSGNYPYIKLFFTDGANTSGTEIFQAQVSCYVADFSATDDVAFATAQVFTTRTATAANRSGSENLQFNSTSMSGCVAGASMIVKITRNTDTAASVVNVSKATITIPRLLVQQAN